MRTKKIRRYKRILKEIERWRSEVIELDLENVQSTNRDYVKIWVSPYSDLELGNSISPQPSGEARTKILEALLDIYDNWKLALDKLGEPYYLKIWLYDQRFSNSQVVCAIGPFLDFYETTFQHLYHQRLCE